MTPRRPTTRAQHVVLDASAEHARAFRKSAGHWPGNRCPARQIEYVAAPAANGVIVFFHDTVDALPAVLPGQPTQESRFDERLDGQIHRGERQRRMASAQHAM